ncbi:VPA1262 family protein, partial [uncultured Porphyromonas sp.]|uniref:VPA1262 family protein n=1 Tax=uncultured Porphyromonas sp. TaxID=159274 RepID=UPI002621268E
MNPKITYLSLRLFILRIGEDKNNPIYRIAYGVVSPSDHSMEKATVSKFSQFGSYGNKKVYLGSISIFSEGEKVLGIYDALSMGNSLKTSLNKYGIKNDSLRYDVEYIYDGVSVPWHKANILGNQLSDSRYICMLKPETLFEIDGHLLDQEELENAMRSLSVKLREGTGLPFDTSYDHIGNLEILIAPDQDIYGRSLVKYWQDKDTFSQHVELSSELTHGADLVTVNIKITVGGGVITTDTLVSEKPVENENSTFSIPSEYPPKAVEIKIWLTKSSEVKLVHLSTHHYIEAICFSLAIVQSEIHIQSDWLERVKGAMHKNKKELVDIASSVQRTHSESHHIRNEDFPQWLKRKSTIKSIERCDDAYFPVGWDCKTQESGSLAFLEWFKAKTNGAKWVFLQDPYFEDVALSFIALTDIQGECIILTQTDLRTNADNTISTSSTSQRKAKILSMIKDYPSLYGSMRLIIRDMPGSGPKLHDRYLFIGHDDDRCEGYMLSNSLQGATKKSPLLITRIGTPVLVKVKKHITKLIDPDEVETIYHYSDRTSSMPQEDQEIADPDFYDCLQAMNHPLDPDCLDQVLNDILMEKTADRISTFSYYLAHSSNDELYSIRQVMGARIATNPKAIEALKSFILDHHNSSFPIGFEGGSWRGYRNNYFSDILEASYHEIVHRNHTQLIDSCYKDLWYGGWGMEYACMLLIKASAQDTIDTLKQLRDQLVKIKTDKTITSIYKITNTLLCMIFNSVVFDWDGDLMEKMLIDGNDWCRGLGALILIYKANYSNFDIRTYSKLLQSHDERITLCNTLIFSSERNIKRTDIYDHLIEEIKESDIEYAYKNILDILRDCYPLKTQETYINKIYRPLIQDGRLDRDILSSRLTEYLFDEYIQSGTKSGSDVLVMSLSLINGSLKALQEKSQKLLMETERKLNRLIIKDHNNVFQACSALKNLRSLLERILAEHPSPSSELVKINDEILSLLRRVG